MAPVDTDCAATLILGHQSACTPSHSTPNRTLIGWSDPEVDRAAEPALSLNADIQARWLAALKALVLARVWLITLEETDAMRSQLKHYYSVTEN